MGGPRVTHPFILSPICDYTELTIDFLKQLCEYTKMDSYGSSNKGGIIWKISYCLGPLLSAHKTIENADHQRMVLEDFDTQKTVMEDFDPQEMVLEDFDPQEMVLEDFDPQKMVLEDFDP